MEKLKDIIAAAKPKGSWLNEMHKNLLPLPYTAGLRNVDVFKFLLEQGEVEANAVITEGHGKGLTLYFFAAMLGQVDVMKLLHEKHGVDINAAIVGGEHDGETPLYTASLNGHYEVIKFLLDQQVDANAPLASGTHKGFTCICAASHKGHAEVVELFLEHKVDANKPNTGDALQGYTPLFIAAERNHPKVVQLLLKHGVKPNEPLQSGKEKGKTPLFIALYYRRIEVLEILLQHDDVDVNELLDTGLCNGYGDPVRMTPLQFVKSPTLIRKERAYDTIRCLLNHGALASDLYILPCDGSPLAKKLVLYSRLYRLFQKNPGTFIKLVQVTMSQADALPIPAFTFGDGENLLHKLVGLYRQAKKGSHQQKILMSLIKQLAPQENLHRPNKDGDYPYDLALKGGAQLGGELLYCLGTPDDHDLVKYLLDVFLPLINKGKLSRWTNDEKLTVTAVVRPSRITVQIMLAQARELLLYELDKLLGHVSNGMLTSHSNQWLKILKELVDNELKESSTIEAAEAINERQCQNFRGLLVNLQKINRDAMYSQAADCSKDQKYQQGENIIIEQGLMTEPPSSSEIDDNPPTQPTSDVKVIELDNTWLANSKRSQPKTNKKATKPINNKKSQKYFPTTQKSLTEKGSEQEKLEQAIEKDDMGIVKQLLGTMSPLTTDKQQATLLLAAKNDRAEIFSFLLQTFKVDITDPDQVFKLLETLIYAALDSGQKAVAQWLLNYVKDIGDEKILELLLQELSVNSARTAGPVYRLTWLLDQIKHFETSENTWETTVDTCLKFAIENNLWEKVRVLLEEYPCVDINVPIKHTQAKLQTPLLYALFSKANNVVEGLIRYFPEFDVKDQMLSFACHNYNANVFYNADTKQDECIIRLLFERGVSIKPIMEPSNSGIMMEMTNDQVIPCIILYKAFSSGDYKELQDIINYLDVLSILAFTYEAGNNLLHLCIETYLKAEPGSSTRVQLFPIIKMLSKQDKLHRANEQGQFPCDLVMLSGKEQDSLLLRAVSTKYDRALHKLFSPETLSCIELVLCHNYDVNDVVVCGKQQNETSDGVTVAAAIVSQIDYLLQCHRRGEMTLRSVTLLNTLASYVSGYKESQSNKVDDDETKFMTYVLPEEEMDKRVIKCLKQLNNLNRRLYIKSSTQVSQLDGFGVFGDSQESGVTESENSKEIIFTK